MNDEKKSAYWISTLSVRQQNWYGRHSKHFVDTGHAIYQVGKRQGQHIAKFAELHSINPTNLSNHLKKDQYQLLWFLYYNQ